MNYRKAIMLISLIFIGFIYGFGVSQYKWFPYENLKKFKNTMIDGVKQPLSIIDLALSSSSKNSDYWSVLKTDINQLKDPIILNDFRFDWIRVKDPHIKKTSAAKLVGEEVHYINYDDIHILSKLNIKNKNLKDDINAGIKAVFEFQGQTMIYVAYTDGECATAKLVSLENNKTFLQLKCIERKMANLMEVGGGVLILNENEFLLSTGTPTNIEANYDHNIELLAQDNQSYWGKILKFTFYNDESPNISIYTKGHRNPQGISIVDDQIYSVEHGPRGGDEINLIIQGMNYGWPLQSFGTQYNLDKINKDSKNIENHNLPIYSFMPSIGISSIGKCPKNYSTYYEPFKCITVSSLRAGAIFFVILDEDKVYFTERLDLESRIRRFFILNNKLIAITDYQGVIVGELNELNNKNYE